MPGPRPSGQTAGMFATLTEDRRRAVAWVLALSTCIAPGLGAAQTALADRHAALQAELSKSPFGRPLLLEANDRDDAPEGAVHAVLDHPQARVVEALRGPEGWCAVMLLQTNIKRCTVQGATASRQLEVAVARRYTDPVEQAESIRFEHRVIAAGADRLEVALVADAGPVGTRDYALRFEAVPLDAGRSIVRMTYAYRPGLAARLATQAYLATAGRDKVGFTVTGRDADGKPIHVGGIRGVAERNTMRYFLAIEALLGSLDGPPAPRLDKRLRDFHAALERHPAQLHETRLDEYLAMKRREIGTGTE